MMEFLETPRPTFALFYLVIDTFAERVRLLSRPGEKGYAQEVEVRLGEQLAPPDPWSLILDTSVLAG